MLFTDGLLEVVRDDDQMFGVERVRAVVAASGGGPDRVVSGLVNAATVFRGAGQEGLADDCTIVALEVGA